MNRINIAAIFLVFLNCTLVAWGITKQSPTLNEPAHLVAGISHWRYARFELYRVNPPLVRLIATLPVHFMEFQTDWRYFNDSPGARPIHQLGREFIAANKERSVQILFIARWACLPLTVLGSSICFFWAKDLYGEKAAILSLVLWCFSPNILAHAQLITPDLGATSLGLAATYFFWKWLSAPSWKNNILCGIVLGLAELSKASWIILYGVFPLLWLFWTMTTNTQKIATISEWFRKVTQLFVIIIISLYVLNMGYAFDGSFKRLGNYHFVSQSLSGKQSGDNNVVGNRFVGTWLENVIVPLPVEYLRGIDIQKKDFEKFGKPSYLRGSFQEDGWWYYYLYALLVKVPLGTLGLVVLASTCKLKSERYKKIRDEIVLLTPAISLLIFVSLQTGINHHMRYVLPIFPFFFVWIGRIAVSCFFGLKKTRRIIFICLVWSIGSSVWYFPHSLSYFNELAGGPLRGHSHLINSNIDWGQDLLYLKKWISDHNIKEPINLAYYGSLDPMYLGISYQPATFLISKKNKSSERNNLSRAHYVPGWYAISVNYLRGYSSPIPLGDNLVGGSPAYAYSYFLNLKPDAMAGYSIYLYYLDEKKIKKLEEIVNN